MKAIVRTVNPDITVIEWNDIDDNLGPVSGNITITHKGQGNYDVDSEALSLETILKIVKAI